MKQAYAPNGLRIVGFSEKYLTSYYILGFDENDGTPIDDENRGAEICWDGGAEPLLDADGKQVYFDQQGIPWTLDECEMRSENRDEPPPGYDVEEDSDQPGKWVWRSDEDGCDSSFDSRAEAIADAWLDFE